MKRVKQTVEGLKRVRLKTLILLIILLMFNAYAWFVYTTRISGDFIASIDSWNITFRDGEDEDATEILFNAGRIYPRHENS